MSSDPKARARSLANLKNGRGAEQGQQVALKHGARSKLPVGDIARAREDIQEALAAAAPLRDKDGALPKRDAIAVEVVAAALSRYRYMQEYLERVTPFTSSGRLRYVLVRELRRSERQLMSELDQLGMTPRGRAALGLDLVRTGSEMQKHVQPNRSPEHLRRVAEILQRSRAIPTLEDEIIDSRATERNDHE
jgi:hypothetical protein